MDHKLAKEKALELFKKAGIVLTREEIDNMEIVDFGLNNLEKYGFAIVVYVNNECYCAKELALLPRQTCIQHIHPPVNGSPGKMETFRCRWGEVYLYIPGDETKNPKAIIPQERREYFTALKEIVLRPGDQYTLAPNTWHWFQAGDEGAVISEFSTHSDDPSDKFVDPDVKR